MDLAQLIARILATVVSGQPLLFRFANNPATQFGVGSEVFLGATILPEQSVDGNVVEDENIAYRSIIAADGTRYSPVQLREGAARFGSMFARLADNDIGKEFTGSDYDNLRRLLGRGGTFEQGQARFLGWLDKEIIQALQRKNELYRWQAIENASIVRIGDNGYIETIAYPNPAAHRRTVSVDWDAVSGGVSTNDPFTDLFGVFEDARNKNIIFERIIMSTKTQFRLIKNTKVQDRARWGGQGFIPPVSQILRVPMAVPQLASAFTSAGFPVPEVWDGTYEDESGTRRYLHEDKIVFIGRTGEQAEVVPENGQPFYLPNVLGYLGVGTTQGEDDPGRIVTLKAFTDDKPYRVESKGWQTSLPVIRNPEHIFVLDSTP